MTTTSVKKKKSTKKKTTTTSDESKARSGRVQSVAFYVKATTLSVFFFLFASSGFLSSRNWSASSSSSSSSSLARRGGGSEGGGDVVLGAAAAASRSFFFPGDGESDEEEDGEEEEEERRRRKLLTSKFARVESGLTNKVKNQQLSDSLKSNAANIGHKTDSYAQKKAGLESRATVAKSLKGARLAANAKRKNEAIREGQNAVGLAMAAAKEKKRGVLSNMEDFKKMKEKEREEKSQRVEARVGAMKSKLKDRADEALRKKKIKDLENTLHHKRVVGKWAEAADKVVAEEKEEAKRKKEELKKEQEEKRKEKAKKTWSKMSTAMDAVKQFKEIEEDEDPQVEMDGGCCS